MRVRRDFLCLVFAVAYGGWLPAKGEDAVDISLRGVKPLEHQSTALSDAPQIVLERRYTIQQPNRGYSFDVLKFSPDGKVLAGGRWDGSGTCDVVLLDVPRRKALHTLAHSVEVHDGYYRIGALAFLPPGDRLATGCTRANSVFLWDVRTGRLLDRLDLGRRATFGVTGLAAFPGGKRIIVCSTTGLIVWDVQTKTQTSLRMDEHVPMSPREDRPIPRHCYRVAFNADSSEFATLVNGVFFLPRLLVWDARTCRVIRAIPTPREGCWEMAVSPDGSSLAVDFSHRQDDTAPFKRYVGVWDTKTGQMRLAGNVFDYSIYSVAFTGDSRYILAVGQHDDPEEPGKGGGQLHLGAWDVATGKLVNRVQLGAKLPPMSVAISADNKLLAVPSGGDIDIYAIQYADKAASPKK